MTQSSENDPDPGVYDFPYSFTVIQKTVGQIRRDDYSKEDVLASWGGRFESTYWLERLVREGKIIREGGRDLSVFHYGPAKEFSAYLAGGVPCHRLINGKPYYPPVLGWSRYPSVWSIYIGSFDQQRIIDCPPEQTIVVEVRDMM
ncbi:hypothetical protein AGMMS50256_14850 [Betaproteobacteria bacterium]|nr:hypothetical protein AGMMS50256_14850 [Betaproteobacteria bacterium]